MINVQDPQYQNPDRYPIPEALVVNATELESDRKLDPITVALLVGFSDVFFLRHAGEPFSTMLLGMAVYSEQIGATEQEIREAIGQIRREIAQRVTKGATSANASA